MIPFLFNENWFSFFVADHLLVGQLCTNRKSDRSLLSCLKVTQCSTSEIGDVLLYNSCSLPIQVMITGWFNVPRVMKTKFLAMAMVMVFGVVSCDGHIMPPHILLESQHQRVPGFAEECADPLVQSGGRLLTLGVAAGLGARPQVQRNPGLASEGVLRLCTLLSLPPSSPDLNQLDYFVGSYVENITNMTSHNTKANLIAAIRWVFIELLPALVEKACSYFWICIEAVIEAEGSYIE